MRFPGPRALAFLPGRSVDQDDIGPRDGSGSVGSWHKTQDVGIWQDGSRFQHRERGGVGDHGPPCS